MKKCFALSFFIHVLAPLSLTLHKSECVSTSCSTDTNTHSSQMKGSLGVRGECTLHFLVGSGVGVGLQLCINVHMGWNGGV